MGADATAPVGVRLRGAVVAGLRASLLTIWLLLRIIVPITLAVSLLEWVGALELVARFLEPLMRLLGLPGEATLVFISSVFLNIYSAIAVALTISLDLRAATILALMCLTAHNLVVETAVMRKAGSSGLKMAALRIGMALVAALALDLLLPEALSALPFSSGTAGAHQTLAAMLGSWGLATGKLAAKIVLFVLAVMVLQQLLRELRVTEALARAFAPLMRLFGLPREASFLWIVVNTVGYAYGAGVIDSEIRAGHMAKPDADLFNHHAALCHSLVEDTALFLAVGIPFFWITLPRLALALAVVWLERGRRRLRRRRLGSHLEAALPLPATDVNEPDHDRSGRGEGGGETDTEEPG